ncbi:MAG: ribbon-helix-helix domain-containing protein [bacterium]
MARQTNVLSLSLPANLAQAVDELAHATDQNRSELIRAALRDYVADQSEDRERFIKAYKATRGEPTISMKQLKKKYDL